MSVSKKILQLRLNARKTQSQVAGSAGLAVSYLSRLENGRMTPSIRTLDRIAGALGVPITAFFDREPVLESGDQCPVSSSGRCILDQLHVGRGRKPKAPAESYSSRQLEILRMCNFLLHQGDKEIISSLSTLMKSLLGLAASRNKPASLKKREGIYSVSSGLRVL